MGKLLVETCKVCGELLKMYDIEEDMLTVWVYCSRYERKDGYVAYSGRHTVHGVFVNLDTMEKIKKGELSYFSREYPDGTRYYTV